MEKDNPIPAAYGGSGWSPRRTSLREEAGSIWGSFGTSSEWKHLKSVLMHRPGPEIDRVLDPDQVQFLEVPDSAIARQQHEAIHRVFKEAGVSVHYVSPPLPPPPNLMFVADLFFMTPEGAIIGRPASQVRAGEEVLLARRLADLGIPILTSIGGRGTFEGADAAWLTRDSVLVATGLRTNAEGASQIRDTLMRIGVRCSPVQLPGGAMHLMGILRFVDHDLAIGWPGLLPDETVGILEQVGFRVEMIPDEREARQGHALNFVTLGSRHIVAPAGNPVTASFFRSLGVEVEQVEVSELRKAAGAIGCLTGVLERAL